MLAAADAKLRHMVDPVFVAHSEVVVHWASAVWEGWIPIVAMHKAVAKARSELTRPKRHWAVVKGPAAALVATLAKIGWTITDAVTVCTDKMEVSFLKDSPACLRRW